MKNFTLFYLVTLVFTTIGFSAKATKVVDIIAGSENHTILETAIMESNLEDDLRGAGPFTIFAPTDAAFQALPEGTIEALLADSRGALTDILLYHTLPGKVMSSDLSDNLTVETFNGKKIQVNINGSGVYINNAMVTVVDLEADNGVVHVIDAVLIPSALPSTVVDIVVDSENHNTLEAAVVAAGLVETLQGDGPFTVFAPTDAAFTALPEGTVEALLADIPALTDILTYHVAGGKAMSSDLSDGQKVITVQGKKITVTINEDGVFIDNAKVTVADIEADNGVVHVIDAVLIPSSLPSTVVDIVVESENHTTLEAAVVAAGLVETLQGDGPFTVFAPTDAAFAALPEGTVEALLADIPALTNILTYHVVGGKAMSSDLSDGQKVITVQGKKITVTINEDGVFIDNAKVTVADIEADNGVVHVIDAVLIPSSLPSTVVDIVVESENHTTLEAAVVAAGLVETLQGDGPFTVFAPTDAAFAALPEGTVEALLTDIPALTDILTYHVVGGKAMSSDLSDGQKIITVQGKKITVTINEDGVFINNAKVTVADIEADNGVVHVIDAVLIPSSLPSTVVDIVVDSENHNTLEAAVVAAGLVETLQGDGPFTVFAPTDAAFTALPEGTVEALLADIPALTNILTYHVVGGKAMSSDLSGGQKVITVQGKKITVTINEDGVFIDNAKVTVADIEADNGVVHVIDAVLIPSSLPSTVVDIVVESENHNTLEAAVVAAGLVETLQGDGPFTIFAPTDAAFAALPEGTVEALLADIQVLTNILTYHVVGGKAMSSDLSDGQMIATVNGKEIEVTINEEGVFINNAKVTVADIEADNGVVHVIDAVLIPETLPATVVDIATSNEDFSILVQALTREDLTIDFVSALKVEGPFTVFAPTNAAFAALLAELGADSLDDIDTETLEAVLQMHVLAGKVMSTDLSEGLKAQTLLGQELTFSLEGGAKIIDPNGRVSNITAVDIEAQNGVVHVIDTVILMDLTPTSVTSLEEISFDFYPNPATGYITVRTDEIGSTLRIIDISGKMLRVEKVENTSQRIDLNGVNAGVYFISIENEAKRITQKLIVR